jgi:hypothetical protein
MGTSQIDLLIFASSVLSQEISFRAWLDFGVSQSGFKASC